MLTKLFHRLKKAFHNLTRPAPKRGNEGHRASPAPQVPTAPEDPPRNAPPPPGRATGFMASLLALVAPETELGVGLEQSGLAAELLRSPSPYARDFAPGPTTKDEKSDPIFSPRAQDEEL